MSAESRVHLLDSAELRAVLDASPSLIVFCDTEHRYRYANPNYATFIGHPVAGLLGRSLLEVLGPEIWDLLRPHAETALAGRPAQHEGWVTHTDGTPHYLERSYAPYRAPDGGIGGYFVIVHDTTDLKLREQELAERGEQLKAIEAMNAAIIASALDCVIVIDEAACVVAFNPQAERTFGYSQAEALGRPIGALIIPPGLRERHNAGFRRYLATATPTVLGRRIEVDAMRRDGTVFPVELAITEVKLGARRLFTAYLRDLTEVRAAAAEIEKQRAALHQREKLAALGSLLAGVAHELNNPLSIVIGQALMLQEEIGQEAAGSVEDRTADRATKIQTAAERCARIVRTFLAMARQRKAERCAIDLPELVRSAMELLGYGLRSADVDVRCAWPDGLPPAYGDADQLHQVVVNLLINAQQALESQPGPRRVDVSARHDAAAKAVCVIVADNGPGIPEALRSRVFEPYFTTKPVGVGTGVGLAVSRGMVEANGGALALLPAAAGQPGAAFELRLPAGPASGETAASTPGPSVPPPAAAVSTVRPRILIVDDEPGLAAMLVEILSRDGFDCATAASGAEARGLIAGGAAYRAILCDLHMPGEDGIALFRWMQEQRPEAARRAIFVTGDTLGPTAGTFLAQCGRPVIEKPFVPAEVRRLTAAVAAGH